MNGAAPTAPIPWRPFLDPLPGACFHYWWLYLLPLAFFIAIIYKAVRAKRLAAPADLPAYARAVAVMAVQIAVGMLALAAASYALIEIYARWFENHAA